MSKKTPAEAARHAYFVDGEDWTKLCPEVRQAWERVAKAVADAINPPPPDPLPCPFCGSAPMLECFTVSFKSLFMFYCANENCRVGGGIGQPTESAALESWNTRHTP